MQPRQHVFFFDIRNTLGVVDRQGHLVPFRPSAESLLKVVRDKMGARLGVITNVPPGVDASQMLKDAGLLEYFEPNGIVSSQDPDVTAAKGEKPNKTIYELAAKRMKVNVEDCTYVSENLPELLGAVNAGMTAGFKKFPPGGDYMRDVLQKGIVSEKSSGRLSEAILEGEHMVGKRIVACSMKISERLRAGESPYDGNPPLLQPMSRLVWLVKHFVDPYHHKMEEEALIPFGLMHGLKHDQVAWVELEHEQGRAYFKAMEIALTRIQTRNLKAIPEFVGVIDAFVQLYKEHGAKEDDQLFKQLGDLLTDADDALIVGLMERMGPPDITLHYDMIQAMEKELEIAL